MDSAKTFDRDLYSLMVRTLISSIDPTGYLAELGWESYPWQREVLGQHKRLILKCPRQSGKSTVIAAKAGHLCKHQPGSLVMLLAPTENQAIELMEKISVFLSQDKEIKLERDSSVEKRFANGSRIRAFTANPTAVRGYSAPSMIVFDESAYVDDELYLTVRPMLTGNEDCELILLSTPNGRQGFFYDTWTTGDPTVWKKVQVDVMDILGDWDSHDARREELASNGVDAYLSPRHSESFLRSELQAMGERWYRQEYGGEFLDMEGAVFDLDDVLRAFGRGKDEGDQAMTIDGMQIIMDDSEAMRWTATR